MEGSLKDLCLYRFDRAVEELNRAKCEFDFSDY